MSFLIPPVNLKGSFKFAPPYDTLLKEDQVYEVVSVRNIKELYDSGEEPFSTIYVPVGLTIDDFNNDANLKIPIAVFTTTGEDYFYVPVTKILSMPKIIGVKYQELILAVSLGTVPVDLNLNLVKDIIRDTVRDVIGIITDTKTVKASAVILKTYTEDDIYSAQLASRITVNKSYKTKLTEAEQHIQLLQANIATLTECMREKCCESIVVDPPAGDVGDGGGAG